ncbi:MAG: PKD domain-containing protein [Gemmatimonadota bacterium]|nr:PKD domain-containing protein [Gemmatimonadota bacterium]
MKWHSAPTALVILLTTTACQDLANPSGLESPDFNIQSSINTWAFVGPLNASRMEHAAATGEDGRIYITGGWTIENGFQYLSSGEVYDPATDSWAPIADLPERRTTHAMSTGGDGLVYAVGGFDFSCYCNNSVQAYDPASNSWTTRASMGKRRWGVAAATGQDGLIYVFGGVGSDLEASGEVYDPATDTWTPTASMSVARYLSGAATGADGRIYVAGGLGHSGFLASAEAYDPATDSWSSIAPLPAPSTFHGLVAGADGLIYLIGGFDPFIGTMKRVLAYDPAADTWSAVEDLNYGRDYLDVAASDGILYAIGGRSNQGGITATVEAYRTVETNEPPTADAGEDQTVECDCSDGADVAVYGSRSNDPDGDDLTYTWTDADGNVIGTEANTTVSLGLGTHTLTLTVSDGEASDSDDVTVTLEDTTAPVIDFALLTETLWPPNHQMVLVATGISASDVCDESPALTVKVTSNEATNDLGDGDTEPDWQVELNADGTLDVYLRAERSGNGDGRVYTIVTAAVDASGNTAEISADVTVQHDQRRNR